MASLCAHDRHLTPASEDTRTMRRQGGNCGICIKRLGHRAQVAPEVHGLDRGNDNHALGRHTGGTENPDIRRWLTLPDSFRPRESELSNDKLHAGADKRGNLEVSGGTPISIACYQYRAEGNLMRSIPFLDPTRSSVPEIVSLVLSQRGIKNCPIIKACLIGPPPAPAILIFFLDWQVKQ